MALNNSIRASDSFTRPANTTQYTAGDAVSDNATAGSATYLQFDNVVNYDGWGGVIVSAHCLSSANQSGTLAPSFELWLFNAAPAAEGDNAAFAVTDAELASLIAIIPLTVSYVGLATAGAGGNLIVTTDPQTFVPTAFKTAATTKDIYGKVVVRNAYTPVSGEILTFVITVVAD